MSHIWISWSENINIKLIISLSRVPYTVILPEYGQVDRKYVNIKLIISLLCVPYIVVLLKYG